MNLDEIGKYFRMKKYSKVHFEDDGIFMDQRLPSFLSAAQSSSRIDDAVDVGLAWNHGQQYVAHED